MAARTRPGIEGGRAITPRHARCALVFPRWSAGGPLTVIVITGRRRRRRSRRDGAERTALSATSLSGIVALLEPLACVSPDVGQAGSGAASDSDDGQPLVAGCGPRAEERSPQCTMG